MVDTNNAEAVKTLNPVFIAGAPRSGTTLLSIVIGNHVLVGSRSIILKGVKVGDGALIASGSLVASDVPANTLVGGNPARVLKENINWK